MNWFRENKFLGLFFGALGAGIIFLSIFIWIEASNFDEAKTRFEQQRTELNRLRNLAPYPDENNFRKMKALAGDYANALEKLKTELRAFALPIATPEPTQFQTQLRQSAAVVSEKARANKVQLPANFYLGFDEFASSLPSTNAAPPLGQQLAQIELLLGILIDARVDAITALSRSPIPEERAAALTPAPSVTNKAKAPPVLQALEHSAVDIKFFSTPSAARRALNGIVNADRQFFIIRTLHVMNEKDKGPSREQTAAETAATTTPAKSTTPSALNFIVGNEKIEIAARIEIPRFTF